MKLTIIQQKIFVIRGEKVMLDFDLAKIYNVETKRLKEAVRRNRKKFPPGFMFVLTKKELINLRTQFASSSWGGLRYLPFAFTEHGITMLASVLNSDKAIKMNIAIVKAFISLKKFALENTGLTSELGVLRKELRDRLGEHDIQLAAIYDAIEDLLDKKAQMENWQDRARIGFKN